MIKKNEKKNLSHKVKTHTPLKNGYQMSRNKRRKVPRQNEIGRQKDDTLAYLLGPRKDGRILNKDGTILDVNERPINAIEQHKDTHDRELLDSNQTAIKPHWTRYLIDCFPTRSTKERIQNKTTKECD
jgi:hypothetical protein